MSKGRLKTVWCPHCNKWVSYTEDDALYNDRGIRILCCTSCLQLFFINKEGESFSHYRDGNLPSKICTECGAECWITPNGYMCDECGREYGDFDGDKKNTLSHGFVCGKKEEPVKTTVKLDLRDIKKSLEEIFTLLHEMCEKLQEAIEEAESKHDRTE